MRSHDWRGVHLCDTTDAQRRLLLEEKETFYRASDCVHTITSLHGLWRLTVHIGARHCMEIMAESVIIILQLLSAPSRVGSGLWEGMSSFKTGWLCGSNLDNGRVFLFFFVCVDVDGWAVIDVRCDDVTVHLQACHCMEIMAESAIIIVQTNHSQCIFIVKIISNAFLLFKSFPMHFYSKIISNAFL